MTDDIVTRLRYRAKVCNHGLSPNDPEGTEVYVIAPCDRCEPLTQAADEIERLRKALRHACYVLALEVVGTNEMTIDEMTDYWVEECMEEARRGNR